MDQRTAALYQIAHGYGPLGGKLTSDDMRRIAREAIEESQPTGSAPIPPVE